MITIKDIPNFCDKCKQAVREDAEKNDGYIETSMILGRACEHKVCLHNECKTCDSLD